jgi:hypothetical protein
MSKATVRELRVRVIVKEELHKELFAELTGVSSRMRGRKLVDIASRGVLGDTKALVPAELKDEMARDIFEGPHSRTTTKIPEPKERPGLPVTKFNLGDLK